MTTHTYISIGGIYLENLNIYYPILALVQFQFCAGPGLLLVEPATRNKGAYDFELLPYVVDHIQVILAATVLFWATGQMLFLF